MNNLLVKVYMMQVTPKTLFLLQKILSSSVEDGTNLIVHLEELKLKLSELEQDREVGNSIKDVIESKGNEVEYVWFYL
jgi:hypothetical protein